MRPVTIDGGTDAMLLLARMVGGDQMLAAILDPLDRPLQAQRRRAHQNVLGIKLAADAEAAADMPLVQVNRRRGASKHAGNLIPIPMRHLGGAVKLEDIARCVISGDGAAGFDRDAGMAPGRQRRGDHGVSGAKSRVDIAVALANDRRLGRATGLELTGVICGVQNDRQFFDVQHHKFGRIFGEIRVFRENGGHRLADVTHLAGGKQPLTVGLEPFDAGEAKVDGRNVGNVGGGPHRVDAVFRERRGDVERPDTTVRDVRAHDAHVQLLCKRDIGGKRAAAHQQRPILQARHRLADKFCFCHGRRSRCSDPADAP